MSIMFNNTTELKLMNGLVICAVQPRQINVTKITKTLYTKLHDARHHYDK